MASKVQTFGLRLREMRKKAGKSLLAVATAAGISIVYLSHIETGIRQPPEGDKLKRLLRAIDAELSFGEMQILAWSSRPQISIELQGLKQDMRHLLANLKEIIERGDGEQIERDLRKLVRNIASEVPHPERAKIFRTFKGTRHA